MQQLRSKGDADFAAQRAGASLTARPIVTDAQKAQDLAKSMLAAIDAGDRDEARRLGLALRPLLGFLEEGV